MELPNKGNECRAMLCQREGHSWSTSKSFDLDIGKAGPRCHPCTVPPCDEHFGLCAPRKGRYFESA